MLTMKTTKMMLTMKTTWSSTMKTMKMMLTMKPSWKSSCSEERELSWEVKQHKKSPPLERRRMKALMTTPGCITSLPSLPDADRTIVRTIRRFFDPGTNPLSERGGMVQEAVGGGRSLGESRQAALLHPVQA